MREVISHEALAKRIGLLLSHHTSSPFSFFFLSVFSTRWLRCGSNMPRKSGDSTSLTSLTSEKKLQRPKIQNRSPPITSFAKFGMFSSQLRLIHCFLPYCHITTCFLFYHLSAECAEAEKRAVRLAVLEARNETWRKADLKERAAIQQALAEAEEIKRQQLCAADEVKLPVFFFFLQTAKLPDRTVIIHGPFTKTPSPASGRAGGRVAR